MRKLFLFASDAHFSSCHAATIVALGEGRLQAAWFAGTREGHPDVAIWGARYERGRWCAPELLVDVPETPLWNPVLYRDRDDVVWLYFKVGATIPSWTGAYIQTCDGGRTWSEPVALPAGLLGPSKNKPITLSDGGIVAPSSAETWNSWACWVELSRDGGRTWTRHGPIIPPREEEWPPEGTYGVIQPTIWERAPGQLTMLMRATPQIGGICRAKSHDGGRSWSPAEPTDVPNPNSGIDAVRLQDGRIVLACNPVRHGRTPLSLLMSEDDGETWPCRMDVETEPGEYSYPSIIQAPDGRVHVVYTHRRKQVAHLILEADEIVANGGC